MRLLIVLAHKSTPRGKQLGERFVKQVHSAFAACPNFQERLDVLVRTQTQLGEFLPDATQDLPDIVQVRDRLTALDGIDFVFLDGDDNLLPWSRPAASLLQLLHICLVGGKPIFGCGCAVQLLAYLASVGPSQVPIVNGGGKGGTLRSFGSEGVGAPGRASSAGSSRGGDGGAGSSSSGGVLLEKQTGDLFRFDEFRRAWAPVGNVGIHCSNGAVASMADGAGGSTGLNRSDGVGPCDLSQNARFHFLFEGVRARPTRHQSARPARTSLSPTCVESGDLAPWRESPTNTVPLPTHTVPIPTHTVRSQFELCSRVWCGAPPSGVAGQADRARVQRVALPLADV